MLKKCRHNTFAEDGHCNRCELDQKVYSPGDDGGEALTVEEYKELYG